MKFDPIRRGARAAAPLILAVAALCAAAPSAATQQCCCYPPTWSGPGDVAPTPPWSGPGDTSGGRTSGGSGSPGGPADGRRSNDNTPGGRFTSGGVPQGPENPAGGGASSTDVGAPSPDATSWRYWWQYNRAPFWHLKRTLAEARPHTGSDDFFLGRGEQRWQREAEPMGQRVAAIAPTLRAVLAEESASGPVLRGALLALAKLGARETAPATPSQTPTHELFLRYLDHPQTAVAETAATALGILADERAAFALANLVNDDAAGRALCGSTRVPERMRAFAAYSLGMLAQRTQRVDVRRFVAQKLEAAFDRERHASHDVQVACLLAAGFATVEDPQTGAGAKAGGAFAEQVDWALAIAADRNRPSLVRGHAPTTAARLVIDRDRDDPTRLRVVEALIELADPRVKVPREVKQSAALALGELVDAGDGALDVAARKRLFAAQEHEVDQLARAFGLVALGKIGGRPGLGDDPLAAVPEIRKHLARTLSRGQSFTRPWAALAIGLQERGLDVAGGHGSDDQKAALVMALERENSPEIVTALCTAAGLVRDRAAIPALRAHLEGSPEIVEYAMVALGMIDDRSAVEALQHTLAKSRHRPQLLAGAAIGLALLRDKDIATQLVSVLENDANLALVGSTCYALGFVGDASSIEVLLTLAFDESRPALARGFALEALGNAADKELLPWNTALRSGTNYHSAVATLTAADATGVLDT